MKNLFAFLGLALLFYGFTPAKPEPTYFVTVKVYNAFKQGNMFPRMRIDCGKETEHPLRNNTVNVEDGGVKIMRSETDFTIFHNEVDLLYYLENNGWDFVSVNEIKIINDLYLQYLFKSE